MADEYESITITDFLEVIFIPALIFFVLFLLRHSLFLLLHTLVRKLITGKLLVFWPELLYWIAIGFGAVVFYIFSGGFVAVAWSDFFQGA